MIRGMHAMFYSSDAEGLRAFLRDKLGLKGTDVGGGWLIFDAPEADLGVHPTEGGEPPSGTAAISFYCDDLAATVAELKAKGVVFTQAIEDHGYGFVTFFEAPGVSRSSCTRRSTRSQAEAGFAGQLVGHPGVVFSRRGFRHPSRPVRTTPRGSDPERATIEP
jgi:catechol 2,3-dioxygenase-like lactoylglutathione lyase family enzyme